MIIVLFGAMLPFVLWPIEMILPYPSFIEELAKALLAYWILTDVHSQKTQIKISLLVGIMFAFSESILYLFNILQVGSALTFFERLLLTVPLNILTILVMLFLGMWKKKYLFFGLILAMLFHYGFNLFVKGL